MSSNKPSAWFVTAIVDGLQRLRALSLPGTPPAETVKLTGQVWIDALWQQPIGWIETLDRARIATAFVALCAGVEQWPSPKQLLRYLPERSQKRLVSPTLSDADREYGKKRMAEITAMLRRHTEVDHE